MNRTQIILCLFFCFVRSFVFGQEVPNELMVKDLKRGDFVKSQTFKPRDFVGAFVSRSLNDNHPASKDAPEGELWYYLTVLLDHDAQANRKTFEVNKKTGAFKYRKYVMQGKDLIIRYKPSNVFDAYAKAELKKPDSAVDEWFKWWEIKVNQDIKKNGEN
jgi:hypothetical protein